MESFAAVIPRSVAAGARARRRTRRAAVVDLNSILQFVALVAFAGSVWVFRNNPDPTRSVVDRTTIGLTALLTTLVIGILQVERRRRDPFLLLLAFAMAAFYIPRVATLMLYPKSQSVLHRLFHATAADVNFTLLYVCLGVCAIFAGALPFRSEGVIRGLKSASERLRFGINPLLLVIAFLVSMISALYFMYVVGHGRAGFTGFSRLESYVNMVINMDVALLATTGFLMGGAPTVVRRYRFLIFVTLAAYFAVRIMSGSRSAILSVFLGLIFGALAAYNRVEVRRFYAVLVTVVAVPLGIAMYLLGTLWRRFFNAELPLLESIQLEFRYRPLSEQLDATFSALSSRAGFLDMATNMINNAAEYAAVVNPVYYLKSIIDTGFTPGFDVYGVLRASQALPMISMRAPIEALRQFYNSEQFTIFGESYVLFGYAGGLLFMAFGTAALKMLYTAISFAEADTTCVARGLVLYVYFNYWLNSFGMDWLVVHIPRLAGSAIIFMLLLRIGRKRLEHARA